MNTPTHIIAALAVLARPQSHRQNLTVIAGAIAPDLSIYVFFAWAQLFTDFSMQEIWREVYWTEPWQTLGAISNSVPLAVLLLLVAFWRKWTILSVFSSALLVHALLDFPVHADDAHRHFWPLTDWRFFSPVSYWDPAHHGGVGSFIDGSIFFISAIVLWLRFPVRWVRIGLGVSMLLLVLFMVGSMFLFSR